MAVSLDRLCRDEADDRFRNLVVELEREHLGAIPALRGQNAREGVSDTLIKGDRRCSITR